MSFTIPGTGPVSLASGSTVVVDPVTGNRTNLIATMKMFSDEFLASQLANGYQKLPSGLIIQWGVASNTNNLGAGYSRITFPIAFPNTCLSVSVNGLTSAGSAYAAFFANLVSLSPTVTSFDWIGRNQAGTAAPTGTQQAAYIAIGN